MPPSTPPDFLTSALAGSDLKHHTDRPSVTLTFAQSLDAKIAGKAGKQLILSGKESMIMTHWMRTMHDAILIGIGTALNDDPQLNARHLPIRASGICNTTHGQPYNLPRPIILDSRLRLSPACKLLRNYKDGTGRRPWLLCQDGSDSSSPLHQVEWLERRRALEEAGARVVVVAGKDGSLTIPAVLKCLYERGGAGVIRSFLNATSAGGVVDTVIVTVAPTFVGDDGVGYGVQLSEGGRFKYVSTQLVGADAVFVLGPTEE
ncbi:dihydrofolate reductase-like domain-containing protein [Schizophyllum amplum]|uniref:2,5-diamino-6-ribosylamino-4(3H)-pyrimidinone 5'-phosphate reductase n=1 Tax=Schizophyllum amplum TaxID=97359 RepID=A0A550D0F5_9AGAR|nr:dihydrofolate reductase-like domain-containing protein [Auriculariopsis ampla]